MNRMTAEEIRDLMNQVIADPSAEVECIVDQGGWTHKEHKNWDFDTFRYRIKPMLRVIWVNEYPNGAIRAYDSEEKARVGSVGQRANFVAVRYVEQPE